MKVRYEKYGEKPERKLVKEIEPGTVFSGEIPGNFEGVFMKAYDRIVCLGGRPATWYLPEDDLYGRGHNPGVRLIDHYKELDVELLVKGEK